MGLKKLAWMPLVALPLCSQPLTQIEPKAGTWKTWAISSGKDYRVPPPPDAATTKSELEWVRGQVAKIDTQVADQIGFWDAMVVRAAVESGCDVLWTEDLSDGQLIHGVRIQNPFS